MTHPPFFALADPVKFFIGSRTTSTGKIKASAS